VKQRLLSLLEHRRLPSIVAGLAMLFTLPGVGESVRVDAVIPGADLDFFGQ